MKFHAYLIASALVAAALITGGCSRSDNAAKKTGPEEKSARKEKE